MPFNTFYNTLGVRGVGVNIGATSVTPTPFTYTDRGNAFNGMNTYAIAKQGSTLVVCGQNAGDSQNIRYSTDGGTTWTAVSSWGGVKNDAIFNDVVSNGTRLVAVNDNKEFGYSDDGITWTKASSAPVEMMRTVVWNGTIWVAGGDKGDIYTSTDGDTWTQQTSLSGTGWGNSDAVYDIVWNGSYFLAVGANGKRATSTDGITWSYHNNSGTRIWRNTAWSGSIWAVAQDQAGTSEFFYRSTAPSVSWTFASYFSPNPVGFAWGIDLYSIIWDGSQFHTAGESGYIYTSPDGINWSVSTGLRTTAWGTTNFVYGQLWDGTTLYIVGQNGSFATAVK